MTVSSYVRDCQEEKVLCCSPIPPETGKKVLSFEAGITRENFRLESLDHAASGSHGISIISSY